jgi:hypothetical protein
MSEKSKGLGDAIDKFTEKTGIKKLVKAINPDCNCEERRKKLNQMFPNWSNLRQFTKDEIKIYEEVVPIIDKNGRLTPEEKTIINTLYKGIFGSNPEWKSCTPCNKQIMNNLKKVYENSCEL